MIRAAPWLAAVLLLASSCAPRRIQWQPREVPEAQRTSSFAVVWAGARFHTAPSADAPVVSLAPGGDPREPWARDTFIALRVISERAGWTTLETLGVDQGAHCAPARPALRPLRLRVHVTSRALVRVTVRDIDQPFQDGTSVALSRGVPLEPLGRGGLYRARLGSMSTVVRLEPSAVGTRYLPSEPDGASASAVGTLSDGALRAGIPIVGQTGRIHSSAHRPIPIWAVEPRGSESVVELRTRCSRLRARVPAHLVGDGWSSSDAVTPTAPAAGPPSVRAGAPMFWEDGAEAGVVTEPLGLSDEVEGRGATRCFRRLTHTDSTNPITLCFRAEDVVDPEAAASGLTTPSE